MSEENNSSTINSPISFFKSNLFSAKSIRKYSLGELVSRNDNGLIVKGVDKAHGRIVAIKQTSVLYIKPLEAKSIVRENIILQNLSHENIVSLIDIKLVGSYLFTVTDFFGYDLRKIIDMNSRRDVISKFLIRRPNDYIYILYQILDAVEYMHSVGVLHRDLTPDHIMLSADLKIKICGFRSARVAENCSSIYEEENEFLTEYVVTRWYRAPELCLCPGKYGKSQDIWSVACTFAELFRLSPLFPGKNTISQLKLIVKILQVQSEEDFDFEMTERSRMYLANLNFSKGKSLVDSLKGADKIHKNLGDLLLEMLKFNPCRRITATDALKNSIFDEYHISQESEMKSIKAEPCWEKYTKYSESMNYVPEEAVVLDLLTEYVEDIAFELNPMCHERKNELYEDSLMAGQSEKSAISMTSLESSAALQLEEEEEDFRRIKMKHVKHPHRLKSDSPQVSIKLKKERPKNIILKTFSSKSSGELFVPPPADLMTPSGRHVAASPLSLTYTIVRELRRGSETPLRNPFHRRFSHPSPCSSGHSSPSMESPSRSSAHFSLSSPLHSLYLPRSSAPSPFILHSNVSSPAFQSFMVYPSTPNSISRTPRISPENSYTSRTSGAIPCSPNPSSFTASDPDHSNKAPEETSVYEQREVSSSFLSKTLLPSRNLLDYWWRSIKIVFNKKHRVKEARAVAVTKGQQIEPYKKEEEKVKKSTRHVNSKVLIIDVKSNESVKQNSSIKRRKR